MKLMGMLLFFALPILAMAYIAWHVWTLLPLAAPWKLVVIILGILSFLTLFLVFGRRTDALPLSVAQALYEVGTSSVIVMLYLVLLFLVLDLGRLCHLVPRQLLYANWHMTIAIVIVITGLFVYGNIHYKNKVRVALELTTDKPLPRNYRMVMATDLHIGYHNTRSELARWVDIINAEQPDLILFAGDIIDGSMRPIIEENMAQEFRRLKAPVYACLGNHEYFSGAPEAQQFYRDAGIHLLIDDYAVIDSCLLIIGRDDRSNRLRKPIDDLIAPHSCAPIPADAPTRLSVANEQMSSAKFKVQSSKFKANEAPSGAVGGAFTILLDHQPHNLDQAEQAGVDFQFSGHTHRGQVWPISWITDAVYECSWGNHQRGRTRYYVSSGLGIWGGKFRIGTQSEYVVATVKGEK